MHKKKPKRSGPKCGRQGCDGSPSGRIRVCVALLPHAVRLPPLQGQAGAALAVDGTRHSHLGDSTLFAWSPHQGQGGHALIATGRLFLGYKKGTKAPAMPPVKLPKMRSGNMTKNTNQHLAKKISFHTIKPNEPRFVEAWSAVEYKIQRRRRRWRW